MYTAYILTDRQGQIKDRDMLDLYDGFVALGKKTVFYTVDDMYLQKLNLNVDTVVVGHIHVFNSAIRQIGVRTPTVTSYPEPLKQYLHRIVTTVSLSDCKDYFLVGGAEAFVKPVMNKQFTASCCSTLEYLDVLTRNVEESSFVHMSSILEFLVEFRVYVYKNEIVDVFRYAGASHWDSVPNRKVIEQMVESYKNDAPIFYGLDVALDNKGRTVLVEVNDGYALGNYGLAPQDYAKMSAARWFEIVKGCNV